MMKIMPTPTRKTPRAKSPERGGERRTSKVEQVYADIKDQILSGALAPGAAIDKISLCEKLGVSRFPVATAINRLAYERLVVIEPQHGSFVSKIAADDVHEWMLVRRALEAEIAGEAAAHFSRDEALFMDAKDELERNVRYQQVAVDSGDAAGFYALDVAFHKIIVQGLHLKQAGEILDGLRAHLERMRRISLSPPGRLPGALAEHKKIVAAIEVGDRAAARAAMHAHLISTTTFFERVASENPDLFT